MKKIIWGIILVALVIDIKVWNHTMGVYDRTLDAAFYGYEHSTAILQKSKTEEMKQCELYANLKKILATANPNSYNRQTNNCYDQSKRLQAALLEQGIVSSIFINENRNHAWLGLWIEPTNGQFVPVKNGLRMIEVRDEKQNVLLFDPVKSKVPVSTNLFPILWQYP